MAHIYDAHRPSRLIDGKIDHERPSKQYSLVASTRLALLVGLAFK
jgi:hypothetical protein